MYYTSTVITVNMIYTSIVVLTISIDTITSTNNNNNNGVIVYYIFFYFGFNNVDINIYYIYYVILPHIYNRDMNYLIILLISIIRTIRSGIV